MLEKINNLEEVLDQLVEYSGKLFEVKIDNNLRMPAFSLIENDFRGNPRNKILINDRLIPMNNKHILAHILAHEYGHHIYKHVKIHPGNLDERQLEHIENEADFYALMFIEKFNYDKDHSHDMWYCYPKILFPEYDSRLKWQYNYPPVLSQPLLFVVVYV